MNRQEIITLLKTKKFFLNSLEEIQSLLINLPGPKSETDDGKSNCDGFLEDLANRPEEGGGVRYLYIDEVLIPKARPIFGIFVVFKVQNIMSGTAYWYQYFSWKQGPQSGAKGLLLIQDDKGRITHLVVMRGFKNATGSVVYDCLGGFGEGKGISDDIAREIKEELGLAEVPPISQHLDLGRYSPDAGMTNNHPALFAEVISYNSASLIKHKEEVDNEDPWELRGGPIVVPVEKLGDLIKADDDGFLHICLTRLLPHGINLFHSCIP